MAQAIGVHEEPGRLVSDTLIDGLGDRNLLIVLDNCEQVIDSCAKLVDVLLRSCPKVRVLATSRSPLGIGGEHLYRVPPLTLPDDDDDQAAAESEAVRLFVARATQARADFVMDDGNVDVVVSLCRRIDGLPLAIELAAARMSSMDLSEIETRLNERFSLLTKGSRSALPRQQTLRALVDWSYDMLSDPERAVLSRLSVFAGGWDLRAAEIVAVTSDTEIFELVDILDSLVDKSLVQTYVTEFGLRYGLLETIRQFASEKLAEAGSEELETRSRRMLNSS